MTHGATGYMTLPRQLFPRRLADVLSGLVAQKHGTAKQMARAYKIDPSTAENMRKGHLSVPTLEKVLAEEGWPLLLEMGREILGESLDQYEERKLRVIIESNRHAIESLAQGRARRDQLRALAAADPRGLDWSGPDVGRAKAG